MVMFKYQTKLQQCNKIKATQCFICLENTNKNKQYMINSCTHVFNICNDCNDHFNNLDKCPVCNEKTNKITKCHIV